MPRSADSVSSRENIISSRESELALIRFNEDRITQIDEEIIRLTKKIDELDNPKQKDSFLVSSLKRRISTIQSRIAELNGQKSDLQAENKTLSQKLAPPLERPSLVITSKIDTSRLATRDNDEREFDLKRRESILKEIETLQRELASPRDLSKNPDIRDTQLRTINLKKDRLAKLKEELGSLSASRVERDDQKLLTSLLSQGFQEDGSQKPPELTETAEDELLKRLLSEEVPLSPAVVSGDLVAKRMQESQVYIENKAVSLRQEFAELITKIEYLTKEVDRLSTEHSELRQTLTNRQSKLSKKDRSEFQRRMHKKYGELKSAKSALTEIHLRLEDVNKQLEDIDTGQEIRQVLRSQPEFDALLSQEPSATERDTLSEEERVAELKTEQSKIISEATNYFQGIWESGIIKDFAALDEFLKSSEFIQARNEYLERISANLRGMLPLSEFSEKGLTRETLERFIESYSAGILTGIVFASVKNTYPNVYRVMAVFSKNRLSKCVSAINHFGILPTSGKDSGEIQVSLNNGTENRSRDKIIEDARIFSSLLRSSGPHSSAFNAYLQFLDIEGIDASPSTEVTLIDDSEVTSRMDRFIANLVRNFPKINDNITSERQLSLFTSYIRSQISGKNLEYSRDRESVEDAIRLVVQNISAQEVLSIVGKPTIREKVSNFSNWLKKQTVRVATAATLAASTLALAGLGGSNAEDSEIKPAPEELVEGTVPYNAGIEEALRQAGDSLAVTPSESRARYSLIREQVTKPENNEVTEFLGLPISSTELDSDLELPENIRYIKVDGHVSEEDFDSGSILINGQELKIFDYNRLTSGKFKPSAILEMAENLSSEDKLLLVIQDNLFTRFIVIDSSNSSPDILSELEFKGSGLEDSNSLLSNPVEVLNPSGNDVDYNPRSIYLGEPIDKAYADTIERTTGSSRVEVVFQDYKGVCSISATTGAFNFLTGRKLNTFELINLLNSTYSETPELGDFRGLQSKYAEFGYGSVDEVPEDSILRHAEIIDHNYEKDTEDDTVSPFLAFNIDITKIEKSEIYSGEQSSTERAEKLLQVLEQNSSKDSAVILGLSVGGEHHSAGHSVRVVGVNREEGYIIIADSNAYVPANYFESASEGGNLPTIEAIAVKNAEDAREGRFGLFKISLRVSTENGISENDLSSVLNSINSIEVMRDIS